MIFSQNKINLKNIKSIIDESLFFYVDLCFYINIYH